MDKSHGKELRTSRLLLRGAKDGDAQSLFECFSDYELMKYWSTLPHKSIEETEEWVQGMVSSSQNGYTDFVIVDHQSNTAIGKIGIWSGSEIGFMIARSRWRQGLVSEALAATLTYYFNDLELEQITADVDPRNAASINILKKFGFEVVGQREKTFEIGGVWVDSLDLSLTREQWKRQ
ncbi:uncharacterized protein PV09_06695 [Verruconis gallopava]|uniref:N-acetyltransferase domain-containing protein n=1 Tax=Verruconis gallopava TaxID=253628 RepID=A0A0D1XHW5_9PEZI|nr:uncharacterized protein PV09_06695 [Verruconis gallopava]KIW01846.1 hypothetical protein PV09_06695 [Verruconis gallopava]